MITGLSQYYLWSEDPGHVFDYAHCLVLCQASPIPYKFGGVSSERGGPTNVGEGRHNHELPSHSLFSQVLKIF